MKFNKEVDNNMLKGSSITLEEKKMTRIIYDKVIANYKDGSAKGKTAIYTTEQLEENIIYKLVETNIAGLKLSENEITVLIKSAEKPVNKEALKSAKAKAEKLTEDEYTAETWGALQDALKLPEETQDEINAKIAAINAAIEGLVEKLTVVSVADLADIDVEFGGKYTLPDTVEITLSNDEVKTVPVTWNTKALNVNVSGTYALEGELDLTSLEVKSTNLKAKINVIVKEEIRPYVTSVIHDFKNGKDIYKLSEWGNFPKPNKWGHFYKLKFKFTDGKDRLTTSSEKIEGIHRYSERPAEEIKNFDVIVYEKESQFGPDNELFTIKDVVFEGPNQYARDLYAVEKAIGDAEIQVRLIDFKTMSKNLELAKGIFDDFSKKHPESEAIEKFKERIQVVQTYVDADEAVTKAEGSKKQEDVDAAQGLINLIPADESEGLTGRFEAIEALQERLNAIEVKGTIDKTKLESAKELAEKKVKDYYTIESWEVLKTALAEAKVVLDNNQASQDDVEKALTALKDAISKLVVAVSIEGNDSYIDGYQFTSLHTVDHIRAMGEEYTWLKKDNDRIYGRCIYKVALANSPEKELDLNEPLKDGEVYILTVYIEDVEEIDPYTKEFTVKKAEASLYRDDINLNMRSPYSEFKTLDELKKQISVHVKVDGKNVENLSKNQYKVVKNEGDTEEITDADLTSGEHNFFVLTSDGQYLPFKVTVQNVINFQLKVKEGVVLKSGYASNYIHKNLMVNLGDGWEKFENARSKMAYSSIYQRGKYGSWGETEFIHPGQYNIILTMTSKDYNTVYVSNDLDIVVENK